ncbi:adenylate/guanylate cyclase domain-containing protein [Rhizobium sp. SL42]|uniref:adenylate/guanylate cyclase domain-containing protein n=1 Tax=Rhizobium sp. SL42 TaxID=2806346 RepID=UPI001F25AC51|nr:adenylate/guanylate cyclase domain-containing protein [Rhizobium sp. SL42]UJW77774.1 adenylate/guanylate cyclase domain-containing protein [Rhizobium sp. SL42]
MRQDRAAHSGTLVKEDEILQWLLVGTRTELSLEKIFVDLCVKLASSGLPLARASLHFRTHNPEWLGSRILWQAAILGCRTESVAYEVEETTAFTLSPFKTIIDGADEVRQHLEKALPGSKEYPIYTGLRTEGLTDYIALPLDHTGDRRHLVTFLSDVPGGFRSQHISTLRGLLPALALVTEIRLKNQLAKTLLDTYVGPRAGNQILEGVTRRGSGATVNAGIMMCDLRNFTALSCKLSRDETISLLNGYFDALAEPIQANGGEILKFMGDGVLAIFPLENVTICQAMIRAIDEARVSLAAMNERNLECGRTVVGYGIGVHVGEVMYGNIGSRNRLDFTVIGPAVNTASRIEGLAKELKCTVLCSDAFVRLAGCQDRSEYMGNHLLRGIDQPIGVYSLFRE